MPAFDDTGMRPAQLHGDGKARALLNEIARLLQTLVETDESGSIDISQILLSDADYDLLDDVLGEGEVHVDVDTPGPTQIYETGVPGVWWVTHFDADDEVVAEFIEVAYCPEILMSARDDVQEGLDALRARLLEERLGKRGDVS